jgi:Tfp pilus assembly protein PilF
LIEMAASTHILDERVRPLLARATQALASGRLADAERDVLGALALAPANLQARHLHALLWQRRGRPDRAAHLLRQVLADDPADVALLNSLGTSLQALQQVDGALDAFSRACALAPRNAALHANRGKLLVDSLALQEGIAELETALTLDPALVPVRFTLAYAYRVGGRLSEAAAQLRTVLEREPHDGNAWLGLTDMDATIDESDLERMQQGFTSDQARGRPHIALGFALARALETRDRYAEAWPVLLAANAAVHQIEPWSAVAARERCTATLAAFAAAPAARSTELGCEVIFVVGMPRSGSTLIEQMLSSHPQIEGAGELADLPAVLMAELRRCGEVTLAEWAGKATASDWERLGRSYLERTARWRRARPRFTDKLPGNWLLVGALRRMLPHARVIVCRRDPLETSLACFMRLFAPRAQPFSYDLGDIVSYWRDFDRAVTEWKQRYPDFVHEQHHEALLADPEAALRALLAFCGLPFDPACLRFHENRRVVHTHSAAQVRQPLRLTQSRASRYGALLDPLKHALTAVHAQT